MTTPQKRYKLKYDHWRVYRNSNPFGRAGDVVKLIKEFCLPASQVPDTILVEHETTGEQFNVLAQNIKLIK